MQITPQKEEEEEDTRSMHMRKHWILSDLLIIISIIISRLITWVLRIQ